MENDVLGFSITKGPIPCVQGSKHICSANAICHGDRSLTGSQSPGYGDASALRETRGGPRAEGSSETSKGPCGPGASASSNTEQRRGLRHSPGLLSQT